jgi:hypothetical protein
MLASVSQKFIMIREICNAMKGDMLNPVYDWVILRKMVTVTRLVPNMWGSPDWQSCQQHAYTSTSCDYKALCVAAGVETT